VARTLVTYQTQRITLKKPESLKEMMQERIPLGRPQTSEDMGQAALYLASANNVTGVSLSVSGGFEVN
jgi:Enoyl-[acyl-carrier-protein] reductase (NADH)